MCLAYAYAIHVNYERETITEPHEEEVSFPITVSHLAKIVGDNAFTLEEVYEDYDTYVCSKVVWTTTRNETDEEMNARIMKAETYNAARIAFLTKIGKADRI